MPAEGNPICCPAGRFSALVFIFAADRTESAAAYPVYGMSAYALVLLLTAVPKLARRMKSAITGSGLAHRMSSSAVVNRSTFYLHYETVADLLSESVEYMNK